jgi:ABC-type transporter Mla subunit MlaD
MTIDERIEFLLQSTESLHANMQELHGTVAALGSTVDKLHQAVAQDAENIRALARVAELHHERLLRLEDGPPQ